MIHIAYIMNITDHQFLLSSYMITIEIMVKDTTPTRNWSGIEEQNYDRMTVMKHVSQGKQAFQRMKNIKAHHGLRCSMNIGPINRAWILLVAASKNNGQINQAIQYGDS